MKYEFIEVGKFYNFLIADPNDYHKSSSSNTSPSTSTLDKNSEQTTGADIDGAWKFSLEILFFDFLKMFVPSVHNLIDIRVKPESKETELNELDFNFGNKTLATDPKNSTKAIVKDKKPNKRIVDKLVKVKLKNSKDAFLLIHIEVQSKVKSYAQQLKFAARMYEYHKMISSKFIGYKFINIGVLINSAGAAIYKPKQIKPDFIENVFIDNAIHENVDYLIYKINDVFYQEHTFKFPVIHLAKWINKEEDLMDLADMNPFAIIVLYQIIALKHPNLLQRKKAKLQIIRILQLEQRFAYSKCNPPILSSNYS